MSEYKAPSREINFTFFDLLKMPEHYQRLGLEEEIGSDLLETIFSEASKFAENEIAPLYAVGDEQGCQLVDGKVTTPKGFKEAYQLFTENGWPSISHDVSHGGQGMPLSTGLVLSELIGTANWSWAMYPGLSAGAMRTIAMHATEELKEAYLPRLVSGEWTGTMCLTEPQCGTDLGLLRTRATPSGEGVYAISGSKIFISAGDHDMAENIIHIVLARLPDAPKGIKGISLFLVPKFKVASDGSLGEANGVVCTGLEKKMGIHGNATAALSFENAEGYLIGSPNAGLKCMFTFMNMARIGTTMQGLCHTERAYQGALSYARDRLQMRSLSGTKFPDLAADPIIVHPDVRRMLLMQKSIAEGGRAFIYFLAQQADLVEKSKSEEERARADRLLGILTPIGKAFMTEYGFECANLGMQCFGGHGYIREWGMEQNVRDARISMLYEGTTGIQALDLLGRKVALDKGRSMREYTAYIRQWCSSCKTTSVSAPFVRKVKWMTRELDYLTFRILLRARKDADAVGGASVDYLMYCGLLTLAWFWARSVVAVEQKASETQGDRDFAQAKIKTARFYFDRVLPRTRAHKKSLLSGHENLMSLDVSHFDMSA